MSLYLIHCGFYDSSVFEGFFENHANFFVIANSFEDARKKAKLNSEFQKHKMHIDGIQEIKAIDGYKLHPKKDDAFKNQTIINSFKHRELAPSSRPPEMILDMFPAY